MKKIAIIDADLIGRKCHRFPNLVCMKISGFHKANGDEVTLKTDYFDLESFDKVYIAKVFTDTPIPASNLFIGDILNLPNVIYGGTGFFYDKAKPLPPQIEHFKPDYHFYDDWLADKKKNDTKYFTDYSIGFLTRGCFRHCSFCVNQHFNKVFANSPLEEFLDNSRKKICLLDDNFFGYSNWKDLLIQLQETKKPFQFKQGLDIRLLDQERAKLLAISNYDNHFIFAFDNIKDSDTIIEKINLLRNFTDHTLKFYIFTGYDRSGKYDKAFWKQDILDLFSRLIILKQFTRCYPYVMRFKAVYDSPFSSVYSTIAAWANQTNLFDKMSLFQFAEASCQSRVKAGKFIADLLGDDFYEKNQISW